MSSLNCHAKILSPDLTFADCDTVGTVQIIAAAVISPAETIQSDRGQ
jgi:hypothetical protein